MFFFIDTSALFKRYQPEEGTNIVCQILEDVSHSVFISSISIIEIISNLKRLFEIDKITTEDQDINTIGISVLDVTPEDIIKAESLILKRYMKPVDSIQLAIALSIPINELTFVSSDQRLCNIAKAEGLLILNPENPDA